MQQEDVYLKKVKIEDASVLLRWFNDPFVKKYMSTIIRAETYTLTSVRRLIKSYDPSYERLFMIFRKGKREPIGHAGIDDIDFYDRKGEVFFFIGDENERGKGYGKKIVQQLVCYGFKRLKLNSLFATAMIDNKASLKILDAVGFKKLGIRREYNYVQGKFVDEVFLDMTLNDYKHKLKQI